MKRYYKFNNEYYKLEGGWHTYIRFTTNSWKLKKYMWKTIRTHKTFKWIKESEVMLELL